MTGITPVYLDSLLAQQHGKQSIPNANNLAEKEIEKAFISMLVDNLNLMSMTGISGNNESPNNGSLLYDQVFKDWLIQQELGLSQRKTHMNKE